MNTKTGLWALGLFAASSVVMINCGGDSDGGNSNTGGTSSAGTAGMSSTAGKGGNGSSGSSNTAGNTSSGGNNNPAGGDGPGPGADGGANGGDIPGFGGDGNVPACPDDPAGKACTREQGGQNVCLGANQVCNCRGQGQATTWQCLGGDTGEGGAGPGDFMVDCGDSPMTGDDCEGLGLCVGSTSCGCLQGSVYCSP